MDRRTRERAGIPMERQNDGTWLRGRVGLRLVLSLEGSLSANISTVIMIIINDHDDVLRMQLMLIVVAVEMI